MHSTGLTNISNSQSHNKFQFEEYSLTSSSPVKLARTLVYIFIFFSLLGFINPTYSFAKTTAKSSQQTSAVAKKKAKKKAAKKKTTIANKKGNPPSFVNINPLRDLGIYKGYICFRVKAYSNIKTSGYSQPSCTNISNSKNFKLGWINSLAQVIGYPVFFENSANKTGNFLKDVRI